MKKIILLIVPLLLLSACTKENNPPSQNQETIPEIKTLEIEEKVISPEEKEFNNSGQAKAIEKETDLWQLYDNPELGISFQYPHYVDLLAQGARDPQKTYLSIDIKNIGQKDEPMDLDEEEAMETISELTSGQFGIVHDFALEDSKQTKDVGFLFAQDYMVLARFEICDVTLERKLIFFFNNKQITLILHGPSETMRASMSGYFKTDETNCSTLSIWDFDKQNQFYQTLAKGQGSEEIQKWYDDFDKIAETIIFAHR